MGKLPEAIAEWREILSKDPQNARAAMYLKLVQAST
jgi:hypothetical protein